MYWIGDWTETEEPLLLHYGPGRKRELKSDYTLEVAYVGRMSHRLLAQDDLAMPLDIYDPEVRSGLLHCRAGIGQGFFAQLPFGRGRMLAISSFAPAYAGESGQRNEIRGSGFSGIDLGLAKRWLT